MNTTKTSAGGYRIEHEGHTYYVTRQHGHAQWIADRDGDTWARFDRLTDAKLAIELGYVNEGDRFPVGSHVAFREADDERRVTSGQIGTVVWAARPGAVGRDVALDDGRVVNVATRELATVDEYTAAEPAPAPRPTAREIQLALAEQSGYEDGLRFGDREPGRHSAMRDRYGIDGRNAYARGWDAGRQARLGSSPYVTEASDERPPVVESGDRDALHWEPRPAPVELPDRVATPAGSLVAVEPASITIALVDQTDAAGPFPSCTECGSRVVRWRVTLSEAGRDAHYFACTQHHAAQLVEASMLALANPVDAS